MCPYPNITILENLHSNHVDVIRQQENQILQLQQQFNVLLSKMEEMERRWAGEKKAYD